ncbi:MAG: GNAT family N-acetyltransferase [Blastocatellia bacterium]|nr:GNAT family N-acetyltransferase [Blastocatellia bacterium]
MRDSTQGQWTMLNDLTAFDFLPLATERLRLRRFQEKDAPALAAYRSVPEIARYQNWDSMTLQEARYFIGDQALAVLGIPGQWLQIAIADLVTDELMGDLALCVKKSFPPFVELGYTLAPAFHGQGYATEAAQAVIKVIFERTSVEKIRAITDVRNEASIGVLKRLGMHLHSTIPVVFKGEEGFEHVFVLEKTKQK